MSAEVKLTKWLLFCTIILLIIAVLINLNIENSYIVLDSPFVSNNLALTLVGGVITGITAVIIEKLYRYKINKEFLQRFLWGRAAMLYGEIYHTHRTIEYVMGNKDIFPQEQIFINQVYKIQNIALEITNTDYQSFFKDNLIKTHEKFRSGIHYKILFFHVDFDNLRSSINKFEIAKLEQKMLLLKNEMKHIDCKPADTTYVEKYKIYYVLKILNQKLISYLDVIEHYMKAIQLDEPKEYDWDLLKCQIIKPCHTSLDKFLNENFDIVKNNGAKL